MHITVTMI